MSIDSSEGMHPLNKGRRELDKVMDKKLLEGIEYVMIEPGQVSYRVKFWNGTALVSELIPQHMVIAPDADITIGFR